MASPFTAAELSETRRPLLQATQLPPRAYVDEAVADWEAEHLFLGGWVCVGHAQPLAARGRFVTRQVKDESLLFVGDDEGRARGFFNVCRHRGARLVSEPEGTMRRLQCPYHAWCYRFDGSLSSAPHTEEIEDFDRATISLSRLRMEEVHGLLFADVSGTAGPLADHVGDLEPHLEHYRLGALHRAAAITYDVQSNWKAIVENYSECLHCPGVHPELTKIVPLYRKGMVIEERDDGGTGVRLADGACTFSRDGTSGLPAFPGLSEEDVGTYYGFTAFPNLLANLLSDTVMTYLLLPTAPDRTRVVSEYLFRPEVVAAAGFDPTPVVSFLDLVSRQDWAVCERAQRGVRSRAFDRGVLPWNDRLLHLFAQRYLKERDGQ